MPKSRETELKNAIAERIKNILLEKDWFQQQLADALGSQKSYVSDIVHGRANLTLEMIARIEKVLGENIIQVTPKK